MNLILFLYIATLFSLSLGEFGQFPFGNSDFSISVIDILLTLNLVALLVWNIAIKKNLKMPPHFFLLGIFYSIGIISLLFSLDLSGWFYLLRFVIYSSAFYLTYYLMKSRIFAWDEFMTLIKITSLILAVAGIIQLIIFPDLKALTYLGYDPHYNRLFSTFLDPNFLGAFLNLGFVLIFYELINEKFSNIKDFFRENKWSIIFSSILGVSIFLTFSRSAYLMLAIALVIILAVKNRKLLGAFIVLTIVLYFIFPAFNQRIDGAISIDKSARERFYSWDKGMAIFQQNPILGIGFNNIRNYSQKQDLIKEFSTDGGNSGAGVDSSLLFVLATTGLIGFLSFILFLLTVLKDLIMNLTSNLKSLYNIQFAPIKFKGRVLEMPQLSKWEKENPVPIKPNSLSLPLFALFVGLLANSFFINSLFYPPIMFVWYSLLGLYYGLGEGEAS